MTLEEFVVKIGFTTNPKGLDAIEKKVVGVAERSKLAFSGLMGMVGKLAAGYSVFQIGKYAVQSAAQLESLTAQFKVMLKSEEAARAMIADIQKLAASTPLESMGIAEVTRQLIAYGVPAENAVDTVRRLGDVAGGNQEKMQGLAIAYGQVVSKGKFLAEEGMQFSERGFNVLKTIFENVDKFGLKAGTTMNDIIKMQEKGLITPAMVAQAFRIATDEGGMFYNAMAEGAKTLGGLWSTMVDNIQLSLVKAIEPLIPLMKEFVDWIGQLDWTPVVNGVRTLAMFLTDYVVPVIKWMYAYWPLVAAAMLMAFGPGMIARISALTVVTKIYGGVLLWIQRAAMTSATYQVTALGLVQSAWFGIRTAAMSAWTSMNTALTGMTGALMGVIALLAVAYYAYQKINEEADKRQRDEENLAARKATQEADDRVADLKLQRAKLREQDKLTAGWTGERWDAERARRAKQIADLTGEIPRAEKQADASRRYEADTMARNGQDFNAMAQQQLQNINNNQKKVTNNITNQITIPTTVNDKGETPLSVAAVKSVADSAIRSALNIKLLGVLEGI